MSNHHLRNKNLSLKAKGLLSQMLSLPDDWDYTLKGLAAINKESVDAIRTAIWELEDAGYVVRTRVRDERGCLRGCDYYVYEYPQTLSSGSGSSAESVPPMLEPLASDSAALGNPMQLNKEIQNQQRKNNTPKCHKRRTAINNGCFFKLSRQSTDKTGEHKDRLRQCECRTNTSHAP